MNGISLVALLAVVGACAEQRCFINSECAGSQVCLEGVCHVQCIEDGDCVSGEVCFASRCQAQVRRGCDTDLDCEASETCVSGICRRLEVGTPPVDEPPDDPPSTYGTPCAAAGECETGLCLQDSETGDAHCTQSCAALPCPGDDTCVTLPTAEQVCAEPTFTGGGGSVGTPCPAGPTACASEQCVNTVDFGPICTAVCYSDVECPAAYSCTPVSGPSGTSQLCLPGAGAGFGHDCNAASECHSGLCLSAGGDIGYCTTACTSAASCPSGFSCTAVSTGASVTYVCAEPEGALAAGAFGDPCVAGSQCASGLCIWDGLIGIAFCTRLCADDYDCAGLVCAVVASGEQVCSLWY